MLWICNKHVFWLLKAIDATTFMAKQLIHTGLFIKILYAWRIIHTMSLLSYYDDDSYILSRDFGDCNLITWWACLDQIDMQMSPNLHIHAYLIRCPERVFAYITEWYPCPDRSFTANSLNILPGTWIYANFLNLICIFVHT